MMDRIFGFLLDLALIVLVGFMLYVSFYLFINVMIGPSHT